jgi:hypothetical protein
MPRIVPSEVVRYIDEAFDFAAAPSEPSVKLGLLQIGRLSAIGALIDRIPDELLTLPPKEYADLIGQLATLKGATAAALEHGTAYQFKGKHIWRLRHLLAQCVDEAPAIRTSALRFIRPKDFREDLRRDITEATNRSTMDGGSRQRCSLVRRLKRC